MPSRRTITNNFIRLQGLQEQIAELRESMSKNVEDNIMLIPERIRAKRKTLKMTQQDLGSLIGVSRTQMVNLESGTYGLTVNRFARICFALGCSADELLGIKAP